MSKEFYRDVKLIKFCKGCGLEWRPQRFTYKANISYCMKCAYKLYFKPFLASLSPERRAHYKKLDYEGWKKRMARMPEYRRRLALESYHRRKNDRNNKKRRHRRVIPSPMPEKLF